MDEVSYGNGFPSIGRAGSRCLFLYICAKIMDNNFGIKSMTECRKSPRSLPGVLGDFLQQLASKEPCRVCAVCES